MQKSFNDIITLQRSIYNYMKEKALSFEGKPQADLQTYIQDQISLSKQNFTSTTIEDLLEKISLSKIVYLGDFHTFDQNSKNLERILRHLEESNQRIAIGIEFIHHDKQDYLDLYLNEQITEIEFLEEINYQESWRFPWKHYKEFFIVAKKNNYSMIALNSKGPLNQRDLNAANIIAEYRTKFPNETILILFGELHIINNKLPYQVKKIEHNQKSIHTIIHQNLDEVYWHLLNDTDKPKDSEIVKFNEHEFSLQTSPPWIKYESMIYWYENLLDDPDFDLHEYTIENSHNDITGNVQDTFLFLCKKILTAFNKNLPQEQLEDFNIYGISSLKYVSDSIKKIPKRPVSNFYLQLIKAGKSFRIPMRNDYFVSNYSINKLAFLAGAHIQNVTFMQANSNCEHILMSGRQNERFLYFVYYHLLSYICSKVINPYRKCDLYVEIYKRSISSLTNSKKKLNLIRALRVLQREETIRDIFKNQSLRGIHSSAKTVGNFIGDIFYDTFYQTKNPASDQLLANIFKCNHTDKDLRLLLDIVLPINEYKQMRKRLF